MPKAGVSIRAFARLADCSHTLVQKAIKAGHLAKLPDGSIDPALLASGWRAANRRASCDLASVRARLLAIPDEQAARLHRCGSAPELQEALREAIAEALQDLAPRGGARPA